MVEANSILMHVPSVTPLMKDFSSSPPLRMPLVQVFVTFHHDFCKFLPVCNPRSEL